MEKAAGVGDCRVGAAVVLDSVVALRLETLQGTCWV
jgi:hypothetical protein